VSGVSIGFFTPRALVRDVPAFCERVCNFIGPSSRAFPLAIEQTRNEETGKSHMSYAVVSGSVPIHIDKPNANEDTSRVFQFVMAARNRPFLLAAQATQETSQALLDPDSPKVFGMGALELRPGRCIHFNIASHWHAIVGAPTGDPSPAEPAAVILQVPMDDETRIQAAIARALTALRADERVKDLVL
jgi:hypothetical protein